MLLDGSKYDYTSSEGVAALGVAATSDSWTGRRSGVVLTGVENFDRDRELNIDLESSTDHSLSFSPDLER